MSLIRLMPHLLGRVLLLVQGRNFFTSLNSRGLEQLQSLCRQGLSTLLDIEESQTSLHVQSN